MDSAQLGMVSAMGDDRLARKRAINVSLNDELVRQACRGADAALDHIVGAFDAFHQKHGLLPDEFSEL
jgi:hypothetical protein